MDITIDIDEIVGFFDDIVNDVDKIVTDEIGKTAYKIERDAKRACPVDTGRLRGSISTNLGNLEAEIGTNVEYAPFVEFGTRYQSAQPYMIPAFERNIDGLDNRIAEEIINHD